jgi:hypothetical protein
MPTILEISVDKGPTGYCGELCGLYHRLAQDRLTEFRRQPVGQASARNNSRGKEDETGHANMIVMPDAYSLDPMVVLHERFVQVKGRVQNQDGVVHLRAERVLPLSLRPSAITTG